MRADSNIDALPIYEMKRYFFIPPKSTNNYLAMYMVADNRYIYLLLAVIYNKTECFYYKQSNF
jgi:hypothetical protein